MALKRYILKTDYKAPYMRVTGDPRRPGKLCAVPYKKGQIIVGELKHSNDQPAFVLVTKDGIQLPFPLTYISEVTEKEVGGSEVSATATSSADGKDEKSKAVSGFISNNPKVQYMDSAILGGLLGLGAVWLAEKRGWIPQPEKKNKLIGVAIGVAAGLYIMYRVKNGKKKQNKE